MGHCPMRVVFVFIWLFILMQRQLTLRWLFILMCIEVHLCYSLAFICNGKRVLHLVVAAVCDIMPVLQVCISLWSSSSRTAVGAVAWTYFIVTYSFHKCFCLNVHGSSSCTVRVQDRLIYLVYQYCTVYLPSLKSPDCVVTVQMYWTISLSSSSGSVEGYVFIGEEQRKEVDNFGRCRC